jgi:hypothetical protein
MQLTAKQVIDQNDPHDTIIDEAAEHLHPLKKGISASQPQNIGPSDTSTITTEAKTKQKTI